MQNVLSRKAQIKKWRYVMEQLKKFFPLSSSIGDNETLIRNVIIYVVAMIISGLVFGLLGKIPIVGIITGIIGFLVGLYLLVGLVLAFLFYFNVLK